MKSTAIPLFDDIGAIKEWFGTASNITTQKEMVQQREDFLGIANHELKTPVTAIKAYTYLLEQLLEEKKDHLTTDYIKKLNEQVDRLVRLISNLLDTTRISSGQLVLTLE